jgi:hypothetical protein
MEDLYVAVDKHGSTVDFLLRAEQDHWVIKRITIPMMGVKDFRLLASSWPASN